MATPEATGQLRPRSEVVIPARHLLAVPTKTWSHLLVRICAATVKDSLGVVTVTECVDSMHCAAVVERCVFCIGCLEKLVG